MGLRDLFRKHSGDEVIDSKVLLCSLEPKFSELLKIDSDSYRQFYPATTAITCASIQELTGAIGKGFDIVHVFCDVSPEGNIADVFGNQISGTNLIQKCCAAGAKLLWIASESRPDAYIRGFKSQKQPLNLVMTISRRDAKFTVFLERFLSKMKAGETMPAAWVAISPQNPNDPRQDANPECIFAAGRPAIKLR